MGKTRVYELAQKLGVENKVLLERLKKAGIEAKSHMSILEEKDIEALEGEASASVEDVVEKRITPGIIRRRRKEVPKPVVEEEPPAPETAEVAEVAAAPEEPISAEAEPEEAAPEAVEEIPSAPIPQKAEVKEEVEERVAEVSAEVEVKPAEEPVAEEAEAKVEKVEVKEKEAAEEEVKKEVKKVARPEPKAAAKGQRVTSTKAKILGRVELPQAQPAAPSVGEAAKPARPSARRPEGGGNGGRAAAPGREKPQRRADVQPTLPPAGFPEEPFAGKEQRSGKKKKKKGKGADYAAGLGAGEGEARRRQRREVFEPERSGKLRRGKKAAKPVKKTEVTVAKAIKRIIRISDAITVGELAKRMGVKANDLIKLLMAQGSMVTINHPLDYETAAVVASEFNYEVENVAFDEETIIEHASLKEGKEEKPEDLKPRPPVVTIMGHVDHGKTSLLDAIRTTDVTAGEAGGITQHIGAYDVELDGRKISFLDTPGHEAFTAMRARGAKVTDIVILVVAADDGVMPQTKEAINHSKAADVPIIVAINKIDKPEANPERVKQELTEFGLVPEDWGGDTIFVEVSAKQRLNLDSLLEMVLLQAEVMELKANPDKRAIGAVVEARLDKGRGPVATILVQEGTLRIGDPVVTGTHFGRVRSMTDDRGNRVEEAGPSFPVEVTGLSGVPEAGDSFNAMDSEKNAKEVALHRQQKIREAELAKTSKISLEQLYARIQEGQAMELKVIVKADVQGSVEALNDSLTKLSTDACRLSVIHTAVGGIIESDVSLASASDAIVIGFNVRPEPKATTLAEVEGVDIRLYNVIYDAVGDIRDAMEGLLAPTLREKQLGRVEVRDTFHVSKVGTIAGCYVLDGKVVRGAQVRLVRDNVVIWEGKMDSLKRFKDDVKEVQTGYECGIGLENFNDIKVGDIIEAFEMEEIKTKL